MVDVVDMIWRMARPLPPGRGIVSQWFGENPERYVKWNMAGHNGVDYAVPVGVPVLAAHDGIAEVGDDPEGYGVYVRVINGYVITIYAHLSQVSVRHGQRVLVGDQLGYSGNTGNSTGPHLHWGLKWVGGRNPAYRNWVDPVPFRR